MKSDYFIKKDNKMPYKYNTNSDIKYASTSSSQDNSPEARVIYYSLLKCAVQV